MKVWFLGGPRHGQQHEVPYRYPDLPDAFPVLAVVDEAAAADPAEMTSRMWEQIVYRLRWATDGSRAWDGVGPKKWPCYCTADYEGPVPAEVFRD